MLAKLAQQVGFRVLGRSANSLHTLRLPAVSIHAYGRPVAAARAAQALGAASPGAPVASRASLQVVRYYGGDGTPAEEQGPAIQTVEWSRDGVNSVVFIGHLGKPPELREVPAVGANVATFRMAVNQRRRNRSTGGVEDNEAMWLDVEAWSPLAEEVVQRLHKGIQVQVIGSLKQDSWTSPDGQTRQRLKVIAQVINQVVGRAPGGQQHHSYSPDQGYAPAGPQYQQQQAPYYDPGTTAWQPGQQAPRPADLVAALPPANTSKEELWRDVLTSGGTNWYDNRFNKKNEKGPDFKSKRGNDALWLTSRDTPAWVHENLHLAPF